MVMSDNNSLVEDCAKEINIFKDEFGLPGLSVCVAIDGKVILNEGFGYSDVRRQVSYDRHQIQRIASISKAFTSYIVGQLVDAGRLNLDQSLNESVFPKKQCFLENELQQSDQESPLGIWQDCQITPRHLASHLAGIRHYDKPSKNGSGNTVSAVNDGSGDGKFEEFYSKKKYSSVKDALTMFKSDPLLHCPGTKYEYSTHGFTLLSAALEHAAKTSIHDLFGKLFKDMKLPNTNIENESFPKHPPVYYTRNQDRGDEGGKQCRHMLKECPAVDLSNKICGGGLVSNSLDLVRFGNLMLVSYQNAHPSRICSDFAINNQLRHQTVRNDILKPHVVVPKKKKNSSKDEKSPIVSYGLGWFLEEKASVKSTSSNSDDRTVFYHSGGSVGSSSHLLVVPASDTTTSMTSSQSCAMPRGIVIAMVTNLQGVAFHSFAMRLASKIEKSFSDDGGGGKF